ncbi:MAG: hypothetical protein RJB16_595, partial [Bacteroidota bacterium]
MSLKNNSKKTSAAAAIPEGTNQTFNQLVNMAPDGSVAVYLSFTYPET